jgi:hypothetical protein
MSRRYYATGSYFPIIWSDSENGGYYICPLRTWQIFAKA